MTKNIFKKIFSGCLMATLIAAMLLSFSGCKNKSPETPDTNPVAYDYTEIGEGETEFSFIVTDDKGQTVAFRVSTDEKTVGGALIDVGLISGDDSDYGLYVKTVNGLTLDFDKDGKYWAFYVNGNYAVSGVDTTDITEGDLYEFRAE